MPYKDPKDRKYKKEYEQYQGKPEQIKKRTARNKARRMLESEGKVSKGDGNDVDHVKPLSKGGSSGKGNLRVVKSGANRSFSRNSDHTVKKNTPKK